ncbi:Large proline-rich protein [Dirofilaria immitis]
MPLQCVCQVVFVETLHYFAGLDQINNVLPSIQCIREIANNNVLRSLGIRGECIRRGLDVISVKLRLVHKFRLNYGMDLSGPWLFCLSAASLRETLFRGAKRLCSEVVVFGITSFIHCDNVDCMNESEDMCVQYMYSSFSFNQISVMKIRVKTLDRKDEELDIADDASLGILRKLIEEKMGILESRQRLIFQGHPLLNNDRLLKDYGIADGLTLHMVERPANAGPPPGLNSQHSDFGHSGSDEHIESTRVNVINGEMVIIRNSIFQDVANTTEFVREALSNVLGTVFDRTSVDVESQENTPRNGDLTLRIHIRGAAVRYINSGALSRINFVSDGLNRSERTLQLLEKEPFSSMTVEGYERVMPPLRSDFERTKFGETVLELEEVLHIHRADLSHEAENTGPKNEGEFQTTSSAQQNNSQNQNVVLRNATAENYTELLRKILSVQNLANYHLKRYQDMIHKRSSMPNNRARCIALCFEENFRRVLHRLSHAYHSVSDIFVNFSDPDSPLEPSSAEHHDEPTTEVALTLVFVAQSEQDSRDRPASEGSQQPADGHSRAFRLSQSMRGGLRTYPVLNPTVRAPTVITVPDISATGNRMPFVSSSGPLHVQSARLHVTPSAPSEMHVETSGTFDLNASQAEGENPIGQSATSDSADNQAQFGGVMNTAVRGGIQNFIRSILPSAFGNMTAMQTGQTAAPSTQAGVNLGRRRHPLINLHNRQQPGQSNQMQSSARAFLAPSAPTFHGPGIVGQVIVRTNGPANAEAARRALDAAMQAATAAVGENGVHVQVNGMPRIIPSMSRRSNIMWARRTYTNRGDREGGPEHPNDMFIGPHYPNDSTIYTNDPHLNCQSNLCNPRSNIHNSAAYETLIGDLYQATLRYKESLDPQSSEVADVEALINRWDRVRGLHDSDAHVALNQRGEALFERPEHFKNVLMAMLRRAIANLADADADIAHRLNASQGEYDISNYGMVPVISTPLHGFEIPGPPIGSIELDAVDIETFDPSQEVQMRDESLGEDPQTNRNDTTQESVSSETQASSTVEENTSETDLNIIEMIRTLSDLMQSGRSTTLAQVMREIGQPVTHLDTGFVNLVMVLAYEILQIPEVVQILNGNFSSLSKNRQQMRRFLIENVFNDNCRPSDEDLKNAAERVALAEEKLDRFLAYSDVHRYADVDGVGRVDLVASVLRLEKRIVEEFLRHLMRTDDDLTPEEYSKTIVDLFTAYVYRAVLLTNLSMKGQPYDYESLLLRFMERPARITEQHLSVSMAQMSMSHIRLLLRRETPFTVHDMMEDIVLANEHDQAAESSSLPASSEPGYMLANSTSKCDESGKGSDDKDKKSDDVEMQDIQASVTDGTWMSILPKDWISVIQDDKNRSVPRNVKSFSDAYLGGCSTKRKGMKVTTEGSCDGMVSSAVKRSLEEAVSCSGFAPSNIPTSTEATNVLQNEFDELVRQRVAQDEKFDPEKYPELNKFLKKRDS